MIPVPVGLGSFPKIRTTRVFESRGMVGLLGGKRRNVLLFRRRVNAANASDDKAPSHRQ